MSQLKKVVVYTKDGCHLCEHVIAVLEKLDSTRTFEVSIQDITADSELFERFKNKIPVVSVGGKIMFTAESLASSRVLENSLRDALNAE